MIARPTIPLAPKPAAVGTRNKEEKHREESQEDIKINSRLIGRQSSSRTREEPDEQIEFGPFATGQSRGVTMIPDLHQRWFGKEPRRVRNRRRDSEIDKEDRAVSPAPASDSCTALARRWDRRQPAALSAIARRRESDVENRPCDPRRMRRLCKRDVTARLPRTGRLRLLWIAGRTSRRLNRSIPFRQRGWATSSRG